MTTDTDLNEEDAMGQVEGKVAIVTGGAWELALPLRPHWLEKAPRLW